MARKPQTPDKNEPRTEPGTLETPPAVVEQPAEATAVAVEGTPAPPETAVALPDTEGAIEAGQSAEAPAAPAQEQPQGQDEGGDGGVTAVPFVSVQPTHDPEPTMTITVLEVVGPVRGRWRAGRHFAREAVRVPLTDLSDTEIAAIEADPLLTSQITEVTV